MQTALTYRTNRDLFSNHYLNDLSARDIHEFRAWRRDDLNVTSEKTQMDTLRVFVEWCETIDAVQHGLFKKIKSPVIPDGGNVRETTLTTDRANEILDYLGTYEYATVEHATWLILVETGMRMGGAHGLDIEDYRREEEHPHLQLLHRPDTDTPLKNGRKGERPVSITADACDVLEDYLENRRPDVMDDYGRGPLLASQQGRISKSTIRKYVYKWSRPCVIGLGCPHDRDSDECNAANNLDQASKCPSSVTPHPIRRGYITRLLKAGISVEVVSDRCNVSPVIIDEHYDVRTEEEKMRQRQEVLREAGLVDRKQGRLGLSSFDWRASSHHIRWLISSLRADFRFLWNTSDQLRIFSDHRLRLC